MEKILATSWHPSATNSIVPVINQIKEQKDLEVVVLGGKYSASIFEHNNIQYKTLEDYGLEDFSVSSMEGLIFKENPDLILAGASFQENDPPKKVVRNVPDQTLVYAAREILMGCPTIRIHDWWDPKYSKKYDDIFTSEKLKFLPDFLAVNDEYTKEKMIKEGFPEDILYITGNPELNNLREIRDSFTSQRKAEIRNQLEVGQNDSFLFYAGGIEWQDEKKELGYWNLDHLKIFTEVLNELKDRKDISLLVALHPRMPEQDKEIIAQYLLENRDNRLKFVEGLGKIMLNSEEVSLSADATLTAFSTVGYKSAYLRTPCISIQPNLNTKTNFEGGNPQFYVDHSHLFPLGTTKEECKVLIRQAFTNKHFLKEQKKKISNSKFNLDIILQDSNPTENVMSLINKAVGNLE